MTRKQALEAIRTAGARGDTAALTRLYVENRVSIQAAREAFEQGRRFGEFVRSRDASPKEQQP